jgi:hypothetical protein
MQLRHSAIRYSNDFLSNTHRPQLLTMPDRYRAAIAGVGCSARRRGDEPPPSHGSTKTLWRRSRSPGRNGVCQRIFSVQDDAWSFRRPATRRVAWGISCVLPRLSAMWKQSCCPRSPTTSMPTRPGFIRRYGTAARFGSGTASWPTESDRNPSSPGSSSLTDLRQLCRLRLSRPRPPRPFPSTSRSTSRNSFVHRRTKPFGAHWVSITS